MLQPRPSSLQSLNLSLGVTPTIAPEEAPLLPTEDDLTQEVDAQASQMVQSGELLPTQHPNFLPELNRLEGNIQKEEIVQELQNQSVGWEERSNPQSFLQRFEGELTEKGVDPQSDIAQEAIQGYEVSEALRLKLRQEDAIIANIQRGVDYRGPAKAWGFTDEDYNALEEGAQVANAVTFADENLLPSNATDEDLQAVLDASTNLQQIADAQILQDIDDGANVLLDNWLQGDDSILRDAGPQSLNAFQQLTYNINQIDAGLPATTSRIKADMKTAWASARKGQLTSREAERVLRGTLRGDVPQNFYEDLLKSMPSEVGEGYVTPQFLQDAAELTQDVRTRMENVPYTDVEITARQVIPNARELFLEMDNADFPTGIEAGLISGLAEGKDPRVVYEEFDKQITETRAKQQQQAQELLTKYSRFQELKAKAEQ